MRWWLPALGLTILVPAVSAGITITPYWEPTEWSPESPMYLAFKVKADCVTVMREAAEFPVFESPQYRMTLAWPAEPAYTPFSGAYVDVIMWPCLSGGNETMESVVGFSSYEDYSWWLQAGKQYEVRFNVSLVSTDIQALGPNPSNEVAWPVTFLPAVDTSRSWGLPNSPDQTMDGAELTLWSDGALYANADLEVRLEAKSATWVGNCAPGLVDGAPVPLEIVTGPASGTPRYAVDEGVETVGRFRVNATLLPPPGPLVTPLGCVAERLVQAAVVAVVPNSQQIVWETPVEFTVDYPTQPFERVDGEQLHAARDAPLASVLLPFALGLALVAARRRA